jgi:aminoglycoside/choline kinase family phosphotransferase
VTITSSADEGRRRIDEYLDRSGLAAKGAAVEPLAGDASDRRYFRLTVPDRPSCVLSLYPTPVSDGPRLFANVAELLRAMPVPVPRVLERVDELGLLVLEDLGDVSLQAHLAGTGHAERAARYREAIEIILTLQQRGAALTSPVGLPYGLAFDVEKLESELDFFTTHFLERHIGARLSAATHQALAAEYGTLATALAAEPRVLCHRDYHSRNLMVHAGRVHVLDFQDARMGPDTYDLVSLLRDAYAEVTPDEVTAFTSLFLDLQAAASHVTFDEAARQAFRQRFDRMTVHRTLKALGTFGYQATTRANTTYLQYVPRTLGYVREGLSAWEHGGPLRALLAGLVPEFGE